MHYFRESPSHPVGRGRGGGVIIKKELTSSARSLRSDPTLAEKELWWALRYRSMGVKFRRQAVIGSYIVDFVCYEKKVIIEVDGGQHFENRKDVVRDGWLKSQGFKVLRFWNNEILGNLDGVYETIEREINPPSPTPPHKI
ncbi:MAG: endonuclease domain-containing protein [Candidatus Omnitrophica bacterium]|nr:endonuclease domain-containing protein [Candidatus Omnitrophota bacterium]